jgi:hypothetical protein
MTSLQRDLPPEQVDLEPRLTPEQLAERWEISTKTLANMRSLGNGPVYVKIGAGIKSSGRVIYLVRDIDAFENSNRITRKAS